MLPMRHARLILCLFAVASLATPLGARAATTRPAKGSAGPAMAKVLPWIEDDYPGAVTRAKARKLPIFVESWAPW
jgi:hypothetical protein